MFSGRAVTAFLEVVASTIHRIPARPQEMGGRVEFLRQLKDDTHSRLCLPSSLTYQEKFEFRLLEATLDMAIYEKGRDPS